MAVFRTEHVSLCQTARILLKIASGTAQERIQCKVSAVNMPSVFQTKPKHPLYDEMLCTCVEHFIWDWKKKKKNHAVCASWSRELELGGTSADSFWHKGQSLFLMKLIKWKATATKIKPDCVWRVCWSCSYYKTLKAVWPMRRSLCARVFPLIAKQLQQTDHDKRKKSNQKFLVYLNHCRDLMKQVVVQKSWFSHESF